MVFGKLCRDFTLVPPLQVTFSGPRCAVASKSELVVILMVIIVLFWYLEDYIMIGILFIFGVLYCDLSGGIMVGILTIFKVL